jgi:2-polyprenyl-3-methyl-5-hydroxy-6-metoxy-1,4-benzoquinol methylase
MREDQLFDAGTIPEYTTAEWYAERESAPHVDQDLHRPRLDAAAHYVQMMVDGRRRTVVDLGAGDGGLLSLLPASVKEHAWGYDLQQSNVDAAAHRGVDVRYGDVINGEVDWGDIAVATEMLEHLIDPHEFVRRIWQHSTVLIASSPWTETREEHYDFHTWAWDLDGYTRMLESGGWQVVDRQTRGMFQIQLALAPTKVAI